MFVPVKADFHLPASPVLTALVCLICIGVFLKQEHDWRLFGNSVDQYCAEPQSHLTRMVMSRVAELTDADFCGEVMYRLSHATNPAAEIAGIAASIKPLSGLSPEDSRLYVEQMLDKELRKFRGIVRDDPTDDYAYDTASWNPWRMISASFAHADWGHIIFNLVFFFAFAATVEALIGPLAFTIFIVANSLVIGIADSVVSVVASNHHWTLGLSGVVMGMIGVFAYLLPRGRIRCYYWFVILIGSIALPAWTLALWYIGGDILRLFTSDDHGAINVLAHVAGGVSGYLYGMLFLKESRLAATHWQRDMDRAALGPRRM
jgi:membrane associated rhomboid family serine protease